MRVINVVFLLLFLGSNMSVNSQNNDIVGKINAQKNDNFINLKAEVENLGLLYIDKLFYNLVALKKNKQGSHSTNKQSGEFSIKPKEKKKVSEIRVNLNTGDELKVYLFIKHKEKLISRDTLFISSNKKKTLNNNVNTERNFFIKGIVVDEAITKIGKDYHDFFYQAYMLSGTKFPFIITIKEKPALGRSSIVSIEIDDRTIHQFFARPDEEFLKSNVGTGLQRVFLYARQRKSVSNKS